MNLLKIAYDEGYDAYHRGVDPHTGCPYSTIEMIDEWRAGWIYASQEQGSQEQRAWYDYSEELL